MANSREGSVYVPNSNDNLTYIWYMYNIIIAALYFMITHIYIIIINIIIIIIIINRIIIIIIINI